MVRIDCICMTNRIEANPYDVCTATTIRITENLKNSIAEAANLKGLSFSAYVRTCLLNGILKDASLIESER